ncbi:MAG: hypothetical protein JO112_01765, partial [Planctomycetes bacterium]|nr:hypothetical protein [Planctomycetota bacterium]
MRGPEVSWNFWRAAAGLVLLGVVGIPLALPFGELVGESQGWLAWAEAGRILPLAGDTLALVGGALALTLPAGISAAILLYRTDLPLRGFLQFVLVLSLFVPLPLVASAWQAALGSGGWLPELLWHGEITPGFLWKPWVQGLGPAMWVHAAAAFPWVVLLVGQGLRWVESDLEEDALTTAGPWRVLNRVTLPRCQAALLAAALWVVLQTANEITVTDVMQVRTLAEEVYTQFVGGGPAALARAVAVSLPAMVLIWLLVLAATRRLERTIPPLDTLLGPSFTFRLGAMRWPALGLALI